jgi:hypothetical protein
MDSRELKNKASTSQTYRASIENMHFRFEDNFSPYYFTLLPSIDNPLLQGTYGHSAPLGEHSVRPPVMSILLQVKSVQLAVEPQRM